MYCRTKENFTNDVASQGDKNIMLTDAKGNISLVKFSETITKLQTMINDLSDTVEKNNTTQVKMINDLSASAIKALKLAEAAIGNGDIIKMVSTAGLGLVLTNCGGDDDAPCENSTHNYVSASNITTPSNIQWTIKKQ